MHTVIAVDLSSLVESLPPLSPLSPSRVLETSGHDLGLFYSFLIELTRRLIVYVTLT